MSEKKSFDEMAADLKKMVGAGSEKKAIGVKENHEIEAELKKMVSAGLEKKTGGVNSGHDIETERTKMVDAGPEKKTAGAKAAHEIEADLKKMLNMPNTVVISNDDLRSIKTEQKLAESKKHSHKKKEKVKKQPEDDHPHHHHRQHQEDPLNADKQEENQGPGKKKKKKPKKKKSKEPIEQSDDKREVDSDDSDRGEEKHPHHFNLDFHRAKYLDNQLTPEILNELESEKIFPLRKKSQKFVNAKYFCRLCDYHCDSIPVSRQHARDARHRRKREIMIQDKLLKNLPEPSVRHVQALDDLVEKIYREHGLTDEDLASRQEMVTQIMEQLKEHIPEISLSLYGSSMTGLGLKSADLNMNLVLSPGANPAISLSKVYKTLIQSEMFENVRSDFQAKVPSVLFTVPSSSIQCQISVGNGEACLTSQYLAIYLRQDERLRKLAVTFKYWAKVCELDMQEQGSLPAYCFGLMTIFYLQQCQPPVLPVLWRDLSEEALKRPKTNVDVQNMLEELRQEKWTTQNERSVGLLWKDLMLFYGVQFDLAEYVICIRHQKLVSRVEKKWKSRRIAIEDPFQYKRNVARSMHNLRIFDYFYNCLRKTVLYFSLPTSHQDINHYEKCKRKAVLIAREKERQQKLQLKEGKKLPLGKDGESLPIDKLNTGDGTDRVTELVSEADNERNKLDSARPEIGVDLKNRTDTESDSSIKENQFFEDCKQLKYGAESSELESSYSIDNNDDSKCIDLEKFGELSILDADDIVKDKTSTNDETNVENCDSCATNQSQTVIDSTDKHATVLNCDNKSLTNQITDISAVDNTPKDKESVKPEANEVLNVDVCDNVSDNHDSVMEEKVETTEVDSKTTKLDNEIVEITSKSRHAHSDLNSESNSDDNTDTDSEDSSPVVKRKRTVYSPVDAEYDFLFDSSTFTDGKGPSVFCPICEKEGHLKSSCPEDKLPPLEELPPITKVYIQILTSVIKQVPEDFRLSKQEIRDRDLVRKNLELHIQSLYPDAQLELFGSSKNGFGFHQSDLDICVTFKDKEAEEVNFVEHIEAICKVLKTHRGLYAVFPITTAKVPIVKFTHRNSQLEGDISMYNILARENTRLLYTYASIDPRVQTLGYAIKVFAKVCDIGDASRGSLSSYAFTLMMIHYLQHTKPPLVPVLQELKPEDNPNPQHIVEGWNTWFYDDIKNLPYKWSGFGMNRQSVGELWLSFFRYYLEEFSFTEQVVCIRQTEPLTKFEKLWNGKCVAIEDPFDIDHNLGGGLTRKMNHYILCTFVNARKLYGTCIHGKPEGFASIQDYFFDHQQLVTGELPNDRLCRVCGKIGHIAKECPKVIARKEREAAEKNRRKEMEKVEKGPRNSVENDGETEGLRGSPHKNQGPRHSNNRAGRGTVRSLSDPTDDGSPARGQGRQFYVRQSSQPNNHQSPDTWQRRHNMPNMERFSGNNHGPGSPHGNQYPYSPNPQNNSPRAQSGSTSQGNGNRMYRNQQGYRDQPNQPYYSNNSSDNASQRFNNREQNGDWNRSQYFVNQNVDPRVQHNFMQRGDHSNYQSSPTRQPPPQFRNFFDGSPQSPRNGGRKVKVGNARKSGYRGEVPDVGVTVNNEYYSKKDQG